MPKKGSAALRDDWMRSAALIVGHQAEHRANKDTGQGAGHDNPIGIKTDAVGHQTSDGDGGQGGDEEAA